MLENARTEAIDALLRAVPGELAATGHHAMLRAVEAIKGKIASIADDAKFLKQDDF